GQASGQIAFDPGGRIRPRGDGAHPRRQARSAFDEAGDRDRTFEGEALGRSVEAAREGQGAGADAEERGAGVRDGPGREEAAGAVAHARARGEDRVETRRTIGSVEAGALATGEASGAEAFARRAA